MKRDHLCTRFPYRDTWTSSWLSFYFPAHPASRIHSFTLKFGYPPLAVEALSALLPKAGEHPIRELAIRQRRIILSGRTLIVPHNEWNRLLEPLHVLHLERIDIKVNNVPCRNLVHLQLIDLPQFPLLQLIQLLESNPSLRTIVLAELSFSGGRSSLSTRSINLPSLRSVQLSIDQEIMTLLFKLLIPGSHGLDLHLEYSQKSGSFMDDMIPFFRRSNVKSLYLQAEKISLLPVLTALPHLQSLRLITFDFDASTFAGLESATDLVPKLHTIDLNECNFDDYSTLYPGLRTLFSLPSVRRIRHLNCGHWDENGTRDRLVQLLEEGGVCCQSNSGFTLRFRGTAIAFSII